MITAGMILCRRGGKSKVGHMTMAEAMSEMRRILSEGRPSEWHPLHVYRCPTCRRYHVGGDMIVPPAGKAVRR